MIARVIVFRKTPGPSAVFADERSVFDARLRYPADIETTRRARFLNEYSVYLACGGWLPALGVLPARGRGKPTTARSRGRLKMRISRFAGASAVLVVAALSGCGGSDRTVAPVLPTITIVSGNDQLAPMGSALSEPLTVTVTTTGGTPVPGAVVQWAVQAGGGTLSTNSVKSDDLGIAKTIWTLGPGGPQTVLASVSGVEGASAAFSATAVPVVISKEVGDSVGVTGQGVSLAIVAKDASGNPMGNEDVEWSVVSGGGSVTTGMTRTDFVGWADAAWSLGATIGTQSVRVVLKRLNVGVVFTATVAAAPPPVAETLALHYDGTSWTPAIQRDYPGCCGVVLNSIWGSSSSSIFAVGGSCTGFVMRYDGNAWQGGPTCYGGLSDNTSIWGNSASDVFMVFRDLYPPNVWSKVAHFDGQSWTDQYNTHCTISEINCGGLRAVWSGSGNDAVAVGDYGRIVSYDGTTWTPQASGTTQSLNAVWGDHATGAVFAVGSGGTILYYDGTAWRVQASGTTVQLIAVWGYSPSDVFAVGGSGVVLHYDGNSWTTQSSGTTRPLTGVWGNSASSVFAVGEGTILHYDGSSWAAQTLPVPMSLRGVWGSSGSDVYAVGRSTN